MAKNTLNFSPFFSGLLFLVLIALISQQGGGVRGQSCSPENGNPFGSRVQLDSDCEGCDDFCKSLELPPAYPFSNSGVKSGTCFQASPPGADTVNVCLCCVA
ncbi:hypothetical protein MKW92_042950 [Papaver armeniacum]|nr:hypothetical protein MKW92_042950 [Papaver armeniacum]